jgi:hypothetical protein
MIGRLLPHPRPTAAPPTAVVSSAISTPSSCSRVESSPEPAANPVRPASGNCRVRSPTYCTGNRREAKLWRGEGSPPPDPVRTTWRPADMSAHTAYDITSQSPENPE